MAESKPPHSSTRAHLIELTPEQLISFGKAVEMGYEGSLSDYINEGARVYSEAMKK